MPSASLMAASRMAVMDARASRTKRLRVPLETFTQVGFVTAAAPAAPPIDLR